MQYVTKTVLLLILLPGVALAVQGPDVEACSHDRSDWHVVNEEDLSDRVLEELMNTSRVVLCFIEERKSSERSFLGWVAWDERRVAEVIVRKLEDDDYIVEGLEFAELKAPLGRWRIQDKDPLLLQELTATPDLESTLSEISRRFVGDLDKNQVTLSVKGIER